MLEPHDDLYAFVRGDNLDIVEAFRIKEMPVSGNDQCSSVFIGKRKEKVIEGLGLDNGWNCFRIRYKSEKIQEICHSPSWTGPQQAKRDFLDFL